VFHRLTDAKVLLVGGSEAAAWKAELLRAAGARIVLVPKKISAELAAFIAKQPSKFEVHDRDWTPADFDGVCLAIMDTDCDLEAASFEQAGRMTGVPVNVIDRPAFCQFQFGSIVNRSPAIISISTDGAAPILGQAIRRRVETLLPEALSEWAELAQKLRPRVNELYAEGRQRRAFWERFVDRVFSGDAPDTERLFEPMPKGGRVIFVNAGPGDPELLTVKAMRALQQADVVICDATVPTQIRQLARREAQHTKASDFEEMQRLIAANKTVVHLTCSDATPHLAALQAQSIAIDIIPGVTAPPWPTQQRVAA
jgi:uroporphyrin-III C-methyltransferase/precorrin-2 dehydrogenase/sirohydrochlorin ferrochelatase